MAPACARARDRRVPLRASDHDVPRDTRPARRASGRGRHAPCRARAGLCPARRATSLDELAEPRAASATSARASTCSSSNPARPGNARTGGRPTASAALRSPHGRSIPVARQLGREPRTFPQGCRPVPVGPACRHRAGAARRVDGEPFPTTFYLTCRHLVASLSRLEAWGGVEHWSATVAARPWTAGGSRRRRTAPSSVGLRWSLRTAPTGSDGGASLDLGISVARVTRLRSSASTPTSPPPRLSGPSPPCWLCARRGSAALARELLQSSCPSSIARMPPGASGRKAHRRLRRRGTRTCSRGCPSRAARRGAQGAPATAGPDVHPRRARRMPTPVPSGGSREAGRGARAVPGAGRELSASPAVRRGVPRLQPPGARTTCRDARPARHPSPSPAAQRRRWPRVLAARRCRARALRARCRARARARRQASARRHADLRPHARAAAAAGSPSRLATAFRGLDQARDDHGDRSGEADPEADSAVREEEVVRHRHDSDEHEDRGERTERDRDEARRHAAAGGSIPSSRRTSTSTTARPTKSTSLPRMPAFPAEHRDRDALALTRIPNRERLDGEYGARD